MLDALPPPSRQDIPVAWELLAGVRFVLALIVACDHLSDFVPSTDVLLVVKACIGGFPAVMGFLLLSGFAMAHSITRNPKGFYQRRLLRIYPLYLVAIGVSLLPFLWAGSVIPSPVTNQVWLQPTASNLLGNALFLQTFLVLQLTSNGITWTLGIEAFCYAITPFLVKLSHRTLLLLLGLSALLFAAQPLVSLPYTAISSMRHGIPLLFLAWVWLLGFIYFLQAKALFAPPLVIGLGCLLLSLNNLVYDHRKLSLLVYVLTALALIYGTAVPLPRWLARLCQYLGNLSYPLYLFHFPAFLLAYLGLGTQNSGVLLGAALMVSAGFYHAVDVPVQRYFRSRR